MENQTMKTVLTTLAMFLATPVVSEEGEHICETLGDVAYKVMELRQGGVPMSTVMQISDSELVQAIVVDAYDQPRFSTDSYKREATNDFRNDVEVQCYKSIDH